MTDDEHQQRAHEFLEKRKNDIDLLTFDNIVYQKDINCPSSVHFSQFDKLKTTNRMTLNKQ